MPVILFLLTILAADASVLRVRHNLLHYKLQYHESLLTVEGAGVNLSLKRTPCNDKLVTKFEALVDRSLKGNVKKVRAFNGAVSVQEELQTYYLSAGSKNAKVLVALPDTFRQLKISDKALCGKK